MDLGRLGEECRRFKEIYDNCTAHSLLLLNETFSTTSFEEGYFIARDAVRALLTKNIRTIYNTHMHKLAREIDELNTSVEKEVASLSSDAQTSRPENDKPLRTAKAASLVAVSDGHDRSFRVCVMPPEGRSYAEDIAVKYGVTFDLLTKE